MKLIKKSLNKNSKYLNKLINFLKKDKFFNIFIYCLIFLYTLAAVLVSVHRYWQFDAFHYDLSIYDRAIWQVSRFKLPVIDHLEHGSKIILADHFVPSIFLLSPLYWITDKTEVLMIVQALAVGLSLVFSFLIAKKLLKSKILIIALLLSFLGFIGLQNAIISNFHPIVVAILPLMICFWAIVFKKWPVYFVSLLIMLGFKEDMAIVVFGLGIYLYLKDKRLIKQALFTSLFSLVYGYLVVKLIIPSFLGASFFYTPRLKGPIIDLITGLFWPFEKTRTLLISFATFGFLPLFYLPLLPTILTTFYSRFVLVGGSARWGIAMHYSALVSPLMFMAVVEKLRILEKKKSFQSFLKYYGWFIIFIVVVFHRFLFHGALGLAYHPEFYKNTKRHKFLNDFVSQVPKTGSVMSQNHLTPKFIHRDEQVYLIREKYWLYNPKYIVIELREGQNANNFWPMQEEPVKRIVDRLKEDKGYKLIYYLNEQYIFKKI